MFELDTIQHGLDNREFFLEYLPTMTLRERRCVGCEALIRWRHSNRVIPPLEFIPLIENTPLSGPVTYWVVDTVAHELGSWLREQKDVHVSINIPPGLLGHAGLVKAIAHSNLLDVIDQLVVEVTERGLPKKVGSVKSEKNSQRARVAMDDTAMTNASLVTLSQSSVDVVKMDKPFVDQILRDDCSPEKKATLSKLLQGKKHVIVAEGVETEEQAQHLRELGVDLAQGWLFSAPLRAADFKTFFAAHR